MKLTLNKGQKLWFTSDTHYNHGNICSATTQWTDPVTCREFESLEKMNAHLVGNINEKVGQDDILFHLGDWSSDVCSSDLSIIWNGYLITDSIITDIKRREFIGGKRKGKGKY